MSRNYDPRNALDRAILADAIHEAMQTAGFTLMPNGSTERLGRGVREVVYQRQINHALMCRVYTTIVGTEVREVGLDSIKACVLYKRLDGAVRGIGKETRVKRVGLVADIVERMMDRARSVWRSATTGEHCSCCGSPKATSRAGNLYCVEVCWNETPARQAEIAIANGWAPAVEAPAASPRTAPASAPAVTPAPLSREAVNALFA